MRLARAWGQRNGWLGYLERNRERLPFLFLRSLFAVNDVRDMVRLDLPWWCFSAIRQVDAFLQRRPGTACAFEYGPGASTIWLARRCASVSVVEHDERWWESFQPLLSKRDNVTGFLIQPRLLLPEEQTVCSSGRNGWRQYDFKDYVEAITEAQGPFDLIVIDGRARAACLAAAIRHLKPDGMIVFDNSNRRRYREALEACRLPRRRCGGLTPAAPYPTETTLLGATGTRCLSHP
jgi:hypothetical protein